eukprot:TRINITY_DN29600_c0_g1_i2.p5 TRINITY_DN29600_c0_g1~~TRINITY_DN29600_c0_g1_i2.p5  ORF type:complete len:109 (+),score=30.34 TRINITY_DN29600_c0_g1_i2:658-984(+)
MKPRASLITVGLLEEWVTRGGPLNRVTGVPAGRIAPTVHFASALCKVWTRTESHSPPTAEGVVHRRGPLPEAAAVPELHHEVDEEADAVVEASARIFADLGDLPPQQP